MRSTILFVVPMAITMAACEDGSGVAEPWVQKVVEERTLAVTAANASAQQPEQEDIAALTTMLAPEYANFREDFPDSQWLPAFRAAAFDLDGDGQDEVLLRLEGQVDCGSGGCAFRIYKRDGTGFRKVSGTTTTFLPIGVSDRTSHGWRDIIVSQRTDYLPSGKARLSFENGTYPLNPSTPPATQTNDAGLIVLSEESQLHSLFH